MAELVGMLIRGIRSFSSDDKAQVIRFQKPLTLIVGPNGSGKTTIIECLKYATIGSVPPGGKGGAFVRDPKIDGQSVVRAQVKLKFLDAFGATIVVTRSMCCQQKWNGLSCRTVDGTIKKQKDNTCTSLSMKCAEMDEEMCQLLGVSKAVLDYVIFCHQEDSNWPLSEPKVLKDKFDELFCAERYTKAVDEIRKIRNNLKTQVTTFKCELKYLLANKERADKLQSELEEVEEHLVKIKEVTKFSEKELEPLKHKINSLTNCLEKINDLKGQIELVKLNLKIRQESVESLSSSIACHLPGSDEELRTELDMYTTSFKVDSLRISQLGECINELDSRLAGLRDEQLSLIAEKRSIGAEILFLQGKAAALRSMLEKQCEDYFIPYADQPDDVLIGKVRSFAQQRLSDFAAKKNKHEEAKCNLKQEIEDNKSLVQRCTKDLSILKQKMAEYEADRARIEKKMNENSNAISKLAEIERNLEKVTQEIESLNYTARENNWKRESDNLLKSKAECLQALKEATEKLNRALEKEKENAELKFWEAELAKKQNESRRHLTVHEETISRLFGGVKLRALKIRVEVFLTQKKTELKERMAEMQNGELLHGNAVREVEMLNQQVKDASAELADCNRRLIAANISSRSSYDCETEAIAKRLEELQVEKGTIDGAFFVYKKYISHVRSTPCCPVCDRTFDKPGEAESFIEKISEDMSAIPERQESLNREMAALLKRRDELAGQRTILDSKDRLENVVLSELKKRRATLCDSVKVLKTSFDTAKENYNSLRKDVELVESLRGDAALISRLHEEIRELEESIALRREKLRSVDATGTASELHGLLEEKRMLLNTIDTSLEHLRSLLNAARDRLQTLRDESHRLTEEKATILRGQQQVASLSRQHTEILSDMERCLKEEEEANRDLDRWKKRDEELLLKLNELEEKWLASSLAEQLLIEERSERLQELESIWNYLKQQRGTEHQLRLEAIEHDLAKLESEINDLQYRRSSENDSLNELRNKLSQADVRKRELADNVKLRKEKQLCVEMQAKLSRLQQRLANFTTSGEELDLEVLNERYCLCLKKYNESIAKKAVLEERKQSTMEQLQSEGCKDAKKLYEHKLIDINVAEIICEDLLKYSQALDNSILVYHHSKMEQINRIIRDLWETVYKGDDIDYVEIKSEEAGASIDKRRSYSYRVVMFCGGVELDMRGRCSTGQKVLASIIIRVALGEVFSSNCGFFTLDEPTTNLDAENSESLAFALADLLKVRSEEQHFQLVLITHDNNFVENMLRYWPLDVFYRVSKDKGGCTQLVEKRVEDLYSK